MKTCIDYEELAARGVSDTLSPAEAAALARHVGICASCGAFQRGLAEDDRRLAAFAAPMEAAAERVAAATLEGMQRRGSPTQDLTSETARHRRRRWYVPAAAAGVLAAGLIWLVQGRSVYAQLQQSLARVQSLHFSGKSLQDGKWVPAAEMWYDRTVGGVERETQGDKTSVLIDDGNHQITYSSGDKFAVESSSVDTQRLVAKLLNLEEFRTVFNGKPQGTVSIDGHSCSIYEASVPGDAKWKMRAFLDEDAKLIRGWEKLRLTDAGTWESYRTAAVEYDVPVNKALFKPDLPAGVVIIDATKWEARFALDKALVTKQVLGIDMAVHDIQRCENGAIYVVVSSRPGPEVVKKYGRIDSRAGSGALSHGDFSFGSAWKRLDGGGEQSYQPMTLARLYHNGMCIEWALLIPQGTWPQPIRELPLDFSVYTRDRLQQDLKSRNDPGFRRESLTLTIPEAKVSLADITTRIHADSLLMEKAAFQMSLDLGLEPADAKGMMAMKTAAPHAISADAYTKAVQASYEAYMEPPQVKP